jgi:CHAT domain-containing protein
MLDDTLSKNLKADITTRSLSFELMDDIRDNEFTDLPKTENEINDIGQILTTEGWEVNRFLGGRASEHQVKAQDSPGILHIATHGFFRVARGSHALLQSGLILAGVNSSAQNLEDGVLTAYEATSLKLDSTLLVVLSACETGLGEVRNGEGVYGLQRGFLVAGSRYILMSLWKVEDEATSELMTGFYKYWLGGNDIHLALRKAQDNLRKKYAHPYYWGGFILLGI